MERTERNGTLEQMEFLERDGTSQTEMEPAERMERNGILEQMEFLEQVEQAGLTKFNARRRHFLRAFFSQSPLIN